jgi:phage baseplate assembly protein W
VSAPVVPMTPSDDVGFEINDTIQSMLKQNFKMLVLTNPGERVMYPNFGVGIKQFLFERFGSDVTAKIKAKIKNQTALYLPPITILSIQFDNSKMDMYQLGIRIEYVITTMNIRDTLDLWASIGA